MEEGKETKTRKSSHVEVQERGDIFFFYRPKVNLESAQSLDDVQRTYIVLRPKSGEKTFEEKQSNGSGKEAKMKESERLESQEKQNVNSGKERESGEKERSKKQRSDKEKEAKVDGHEEKRLGHQSPETEEEGDKKQKSGTKSKSKPKADRSQNQEHGAGHGIEKVELSKNTLLRLIVLGRKSLPDPSKKSRPYWGFVELVTTSPDHVKKALSADVYETKTRGEQTKPASRPVGEGVYHLVRHGEGRKMHTHLIYKLELPGPQKQHHPQDAMNIEPERSFLIQHGQPENAGLQSKRKASFPAHLQGKIGSYRFVAAEPPDFLNYEGCEFILIGASSDIEEELGLEVQIEDEGKQECSDLLNLFGDFEQAPNQPLIEGEWA